MSYCTKEQVKKAFKLGNPIITFGYGDLGDAEAEILKLNRQVVLKRNEDNSIIVGQIPTTEELIDWLEEQGILVLAEPSQNKFYGTYFLKREDGYWLNRVFLDGLYTSRKDAIIAAINVALDYLIHHKDEK